MFHFLVAFAIYFGNILVCNQMLLGKRLIGYSLVLIPNSRIVKIPIHFSITNKIVLKVGMQQGRRHQSGLSGFCLTTFTVKFITTTTANILYDIIRLCACMDTACITYPEEIQHHISAAKF